jgi:hypothetical protein
MSGIIPFEGTTNLPAHIVDLGLTNNDLIGGVGGGGFAVISYKGKVWHVIDGDNKTLVQNSEGDPASSLEVVILKANPNLSKVYYQGGYEEGANTKPTCYSNDGKGPAADSVVPQAKSCAACPHNAWGSRVSENGSKGKACGDSRRLAVAPAGELDYPMLLRIPAGTLKELVAYAEMLNRRKVGYQAVVTKIAFDHTVAHQKFTFKATRFVTPEEAETIRSISEGNTVQQILGLAAVTPQDDELGETPQHLKAKPAPVAKAKKAMQVDESEIEAAIAPAPAKLRPGKAKEATPAAAPAAPVKKVDHSALVADANASLDDVLSALDD